MRAGSLDPSFNGNGFVTTSFASSYDVARSVAIQPDGAIVVAGTTYVGPDVYDYDFALVRYKPDGTLDDSFGIGGKVTTSISLNDVAFSVAIQQDGRIIAAGNALVRYNPDGTLDSSFGFGGKVTLPFVGEVYSVALQSDGRIVAAGIVQESQDTSGFCVVRFNVDGTLDMSFASRGWVMTRIRNRNGNAYSVAIQADGRIVAVGRSIVSLTGFFTKFAVVRYNANGTLDTSFGDGGVVTTQIGNRDDEAYSVAIQPDGRIVAAGYSDYGPFSNAEFALVRYNANGTLDTYFGASGIVLTEFGNSDFVLSVRILADGKLVAAGRSGFRIAVGRYNGDGGLDSSFNGTGKVITTINYPDIGAFSAALQQDGKIVVAGFALTNPTIYEFVVVRYGMDCTTFTPSPTSTLTNTPTPTATSTSTSTSTATNTPTNTPSATATPSTRAAFDYDGDRKTDISVFRPSEGAWYLAQSQAGIFGAQFGFGSDKITPADFDGDGKTDIAVYRPSTGIWYVLNSMDGTVTYYQFGLVDDLPTPADYDGDGKADVSVYRPSTGTWYRQNSGNGTFFGIQFGASEDKPTVGDFDGDGTSDIAVFRPSTGAWYWINSGDSSIHGENFGFGTDILVPADYDGDSKTDVGVFRPSDGYWYARNSSDGAFTYKIFGLATDIPAPGDFDGDGKADINVFRPSDGTWYRQNSSNGQFIAFQFGQNGDKPTMTAFRY